VIIYVISEKAGSRFARRGDKGGKASLPVACGDPDNELSGPP
jgi:hypothetical protein